MTYRKAALDKLKKLHDKGIDIRPFLREASMNKQLNQSITALDNTGMKKKHQMGGRRRKMDAQKIEEALVLMQDSNYSILQICQHFGISKSTFYRSMKMGLHCEDKNTPTTQGGCSNHSSNLLNSIYSTPKNPERVIDMGCGDCGKKKSSKKNNVGALQLPLTQCQVVGIPTNFESALGVGVDPLVVINSSLTCTRVDRIEECILLCEGREVVVDVEVSDLIVSGIVYYVASIPIQPIQAPGSCNYDGISYVTVSGSFNVNETVCVGVQGVDCPEAPICFVPVDGAPVATVAADAVLGECQNYFAVTVTIPQNFNVSCTTP